MMRRPTWSRCPFRGGLGREDAGGDCGNLGWRLLGGPNGSWSRVSLAVAVAAVVAAGCDDAGDGPCLGVACSSHGQCVAVADAARCLCDLGYRERGLECVVAPADGDGDGDSDGDGDGDGDGDVCAALADCDDALYCTGEEACAPEDPNAGADGCVAGAAVVCDDGNPTTVDTCSETEARCVHSCPDDDGDGHGSVACVDANGDPLGDDCDDADPHRYPGNVEVCDDAGHDEDCDETTVGDLDEDGDEWVSSACCNRSAGAEPVCGADCNDDDSNVRPGVIEVCDFLDVDENCDGRVNEGLTATCWHDHDGDGWAAAGAESREECRVEGRADVGGCPPFTTDREPVTAGTDVDCDDARDDVFPGAEEVCDGADDDCDGLLAGAPGEVDADFDERDRDGDGYLECATAEYFRWDCADDDSRAFPGQTSYFADAVRGVGSYDFNCDGIEEVEHTAMGGCLPLGDACGFYAGWHLPAPVFCGVLREWVAGCDGASPALGSWCLNIDGWNLEPRLPACR